MLHFSFFFFPIWKTILNFKPVLQLLLVFVTCRFNKHLPQFPIYITDVSTGQFQVQDRALWSCLLEIKPWTSFCEQACGSQCPAALPQSHIKKTSISNLLLRSPCEMALKAWRDIPCSPSVHKVSCLCPRRELFCFDMICSRQIDVGFFLTLYYPSVIHSKHMKELYKYRNELTKYFLPNL